MKWLLRQPRRLAVVLLILVGLVLVGWMIQRVRQAAPAGASDWRGVGTDYRGTTTSGSR